MPSSAPTPTHPGGEPGSCGSAALSVEHAPTDVATLVGHGFGFVSARIVGAESAFFNTADGAAPAGFFTFDSSVRPVSAMVYTPYAVDVDQVMAGDGSAGAGRVLVEGGDVGCFAMTVSRAPRLVVGRSYVLVLGDAMDIGGNALAGPRSVFFAWLIDPAGVAWTFDGPLTIDKLGEVIERAGANMP